MPIQNSKAASTYPVAHRFSPAGIAAIVAAHAAILALLVSLNVVPLPTALEPLMVHIVPPAVPQIAPPRPPAAPRKSTAPATPAPTQPQTLATQAPAAANDITTPMPKEAPPAPAAPAPFTQARFDADYLQNPAPAYPAMSKRLAEEGRVILRVYVQPDGRPGQIELRTSSGSARLDQAALDAVGRWKFIPARRGDEVVGAWVLVPINFNLKN